MEVRVAGSLSFAVRRLAQHRNATVVSFRYVPPHNSGYRALPSLLDCLVSSNGGRDKQQQQQQHGYRVELRRVDQGRFRVPHGFKDGAAARLPPLLFFSSDASSRNDRKVASEEEKEKARKWRKRLAASVEELQVSDDPLPDKLEKKTLLQKTWNLLVRIGSGLRNMASMSREDWAKWLKKAKTTVWLELQHYWVGSKLLWAEIRISTRLLVQLSGGKKLSRREQLQLRRTAGDIARLVPFIIIVIVPFMEFLLPVLLKVFPNMLPSTFQDKLKQEAELTKRLETRLRHAKGLKNALLEMVDELKSKRGEDIQKTAKDLDDFMTKVRTGQSIKNADILGFAKLFNDELTLDNISRPRLISMCKYMGLRPFGTDAYLRYTLRKKLAWIKSDDRLIRMEGIYSLSEPELRAACRERGMLVSLTPQEMKAQLSNWLDLSLDHSVPSSLLILSRAFVPDKLKPAEAVQATLSSLPDEVVDSVGVTVLPSEDTLEERRRKLEFLKQQEELIKESLTSKPRK
ncbi:mitochondrial proton/calcium exchanger protein [Selaginella moellendorffii]|nr:mitochondrial proton/calcium exchanger protein [Selaginella moellendorffii]|eukprot:XP_002968050.2 mitochondrial proton/calcium exchanger protein [Selaginella moellendorffii]